MPVNDRGNKLKNRVLRSASQCSVYSKPAKPCAKTFLSLKTMAPSINWHIPSIHDYSTDLLKQTGGTSMYKGPWFANIDILVTSDPDNFNYISSTNFYNYPKGPEFREFYDVLGDGIFICDSKSWEFYHETIISVFKEDGFLKLVEETMWNNVEKKLMAVLEYMSERGCRIDLENIFQRHPVPQSKIREQIHEQLGLKEGEKWKQLRAKELESLVYLHGTSCEALRLFPPVLLNHKGCQ
ncbi:cytochrome P450 [Tanacetum coccineum]|uniref:Cytochrome P450 n=1 Tax=Tanacetum coccineum TaxID=301880 RepID=A0ABQ5EN57_9ASTR